MAGVKGRSGRQKRPFAEALEIAVNRIVDGDPKARKRLAIIAEKLALAACGGDMDAIKEVANRLDGRPAQQLQLMPDDDDGFDGDTSTQVALLIKRCRGGKSDEPSREPDMAADQPSTTCSGVQSG